jgi:hypothetical protein
LERLLIVGARLVILPQFLGDNTQLVPGIGSSKEAICY